MAVDGEQPKVDLIHQDPNNPKLVTDKEVAHGMGNIINDALDSAKKYEQEAFQAKENPFKFLKDKLTQAFGREPSGYTLNNRFSTIKNDFDLEKLINDDSDINIINKVITDRSKNLEIPFNITNITDVFDIYNENTLPPSKLIPFLKVMEVIPQNSPDNGYFPLGNETSYFSKLLTKDGRASTKDVQIRERGSQTLTDVKEFTKPTIIEGVNIIIGLRSKDIIEEGYRKNRYVDPVTEKLEFTPEFFAKSLGIAVEPKSESK